MKKKYLLVGLLAVLCSTGFAQTDYLQFEVIYLKPKLDKLDLFRKALSAHNKKYHAVAPYKVSVSSVDSGPGSGGYVWVMGPTTWTQMDNAPGAGEHITDWEKNINPNLESMGETMYWRAEKEFNYEPEGSAAFTKTRLRFSYVLPGQQARFLEQMKKVAAVFQKKKYNASFSLATRVGATEGPHVVSFVGFAKWAYLDGSSDFVKDFDEVHGSGAYERFIKELDLCIDRARTFDNLEVAAPELGG